MNGKRGLELRGRVVTRAGVLEDAVITVRGERVAAVRPASDWATTHRELPPEYSGTVLPGLVDIHTHGGFGHRFDTVDADQARAAAAFHHRQGSTTVLASIVTAAPDAMVGQVNMLSRLAADGTIAGIHIEGPFLSRTHCGAHDLDHLIDPDPALIDRLLRAAGGRLRVMTLAPELSGFDAAAKQLADGGVIVAVGHSDSSFADFRAALTPEGCATLVTHLANGMPALHHRAPGPVAAGLVAAAQRHAFVELIGDGVHVDSGFGALVFATAPDRVALVTDAMAAAGMPDGQYRLGPRTVTVTDGVARVAGGSLAGGTSTLLQGLRWAVRDCGVPLADAVAAVTATPAAAAGLEEVGDLQPGMYADAVVLDEDLNLRRVLRRGRWLA
ncbi:N-acetylglucosamine-6-phosphate deacetylase [Nocardia yunnanensis]|uniref:N-acetylglucosamine-6-phosphate deacetylase n=1 Tax=Nocardia yunnanensis TaxID=2382165 RepID=A0A386ZAS6_9NOCA|nr:amidohydrolase family protein [Nocardia yunnanensis]AYF74214.1 N-acetylglucosamine-6-phosphate deacetylase [Nocardia yunnanensis]